MKSGHLKILVTDDEAAIRQFLHAALGAYQHTVLEAENGAQAVNLMYETHPDLLILDLGLPDMDGVDVIAEVRAFSQAPIIVLSVRSRETDKISALDAGADDYLTKPFGVGELLARMRGVMRRSGGAVGEATYQAGALRMDLARRQVTLQGVEVALTPTEFDLLRVLLQNAGKVLTHRQIITQVWSTPSGDEDRLLRVNISNLRRKIEPDMNRPRYIRTELGVGYRLSEE
jgi:two-component system, OmpR family, KDP operon response regulator KdpE